MAYEQNTRTLVATFQDYSTAQQAVRELQDIGINSDAIQIDSNQKTARAGSSEYQEENQGTGFSGWWHSLFGTEHHDEDRQTYEGAMANGSTILRATVASAKLDSAIEVLNRSGAVDVERPAAAGMDRMAGSTTAQGEGGSPIQVVEEELQVGKRAVQRGGVRVYSHVVSTPVEEQVRLREEHVSVQRRPVDREMSPADVSALQDQTIEVNEMAEEPVVAKRARVREEILVGKEASERTETVRDNVRHTEVEIEQLGEETGSLDSSNPGKTPIRGLSPNPPTPGVLSGGASTAGAGTLAGEQTAGFKRDSSLD